MKLLTFLMSLSFVSLAFAESKYSLHEVCARYRGDAQTCQQIPFCRTQYQPAQVGGCHAKATNPEFENLCRSIDESMCNPATTFCYVSQSSPAQNLCLATREYLY
jgi:hypothetical protein